MSRPIIIISDLHLGNPKGVARAKSLLPIIKSAGTLIVNGDCAELHIEEHREAAMRELELFKSFCREHHTELVLLAGNHDPHLTSDRYIVHRQSGVFITHGDVITDSVCPWSDSAAVMRKRHHEVTAEQTANRRNSIDGAFEACHESSISEWDTHQNAGTPSTLLKLLLRPRQCWEVIRFWKDHPSLMVNFCERFVPEARVIFVGHSHRPSVRRLRGKLFINTGCYGFPGHPRAVIFDEKGFMVQRILRSGDQWTLGGRVIYRNSEVLFDENCLRDAQFGPIQSSDAALASATGSTPVAHPEVSQ